jgi:DNA polymerase III epsilon subunit-like protein
MRVIVYDTETSGLPLKLKGCSGLSDYPSFKDTHLWPHIVQLSYIIYDTELKKIVKTVDKIIRHPDYFMIDTETTNIHGITSEMCHVSQNDMFMCLIDFIEDVVRCQMVVGHNIEFDNNMILVEITRHFQNYPNTCEFYLNMFQKLDKFYCTMQSSIELCNIKTKYKNSTKEYLKFPKLSELYIKLFECEPNLPLHNSLNDVYLCFRCFYKLQFDIDVCEENKQIRSILC